MAKFDTSQWYQLYVNGNDGAGLWGTELYKEGRGAVYFNTTTTTRKVFRWQMYPINSTSYVLRTEEGGPNGYLGTKLEPKEQSPGQTQALMLRGDIADDSIYWTILPWGDGTFYLFNSANGTSWHLNRKDGGGATMSSNITAPQDGQRFSFKPIQEGVISDSRFSTINVATPTITPSTSVSSTSSATSTSNSSTATGTTQTSNPPAPGSGGLSTGAKVGISVGVVAIVGAILLVLGFLFWRRHKQKNQNSYHTPAPHYEQSRTYEVEAETYKYEMYAGLAKHEMPALDARTPVELPNNSMHPSVR